MSSNNILSLKGAMERKIASYTLEFIMYKVGLRLTLNVFVTHPEKTKHYVQKLIFYFMRPLPSTTFEPLNLQI